MPAKKPPKLVLVANRNAPETVSIPGFGKFPDWVKPEAHWPNPFPHQFHFALFRLPEYRDKPLPSSFSQPWITAWIDIGSKITKQSEKKCKDFFTNDGYQALRKLGHRGCDPNLVMSLFVQYLWDERAPSFESKDPNIRGHLED